MLERRIGKYIRCYSLFLNAVKNGQKTVEIIGYRKKEKIIVDDRLKGFLNVIKTFYNNTKDLEIKKIIQYYYIKKYSDRRVLHELYCSESTYYKLKHYICERILALCACNGLVDEKEIVFNLR